MSVTKTPLSNVKTIPEYIKVDYGRKEASMRILVADFVDNGHHVAYIPSLKLSAYGPSKQEAIKMLFEDVIDDLFTNLFELSETKIAKELAKYGWHKAKGIPNKKYYNDLPYIDPKGILKNFNLPEATNIEVKMMAVGEAA